MYTFIGRVNVLRNGIAFLIVSIDEYPVLFLLAYALTPVKPCKAVLPKISAVPLTLCLAGDTYF